MALESTIVTYPERGKWGRKEWRGNCSGYMIKDLIETFSPRFVLDPMEGSGTTREVCADMLVPYAGFDIKDGYNILDWKTRGKIHDTVMEQTVGVGADLIFLHPPYWKMIHYSEHRDDFSNGTYLTYLNRMEITLRFLSTLLSDKGKLALLLADLRTRNANITYFLTDDTTSHEKMVAANLHKELRVIKVQHNTVSGGTNNTGIAFAHEYLTIMGKGRPQLGIVEAQSSEEVEVNADD